MEYRLNGISLQNGRPTNMDSLLLRCGRLGRTNALLAVVCDGVGSLKDGGFASGMAVRMLNDWFDGMTVSDSAGLQLRDAALKVNSRVLAEARQQELNTAATLSALLLVEGMYYIVHAGDSRVYSYENNSLSLLTHDDVSEAGKLTVCIGHKEDIFLQYSEGEAKGKTFLVCSDGLHKRADMEVLAAKMQKWSRRPSKEPLTALTKHVIERGEKDNISLALVKIEN